MALEDVLTKNVELNGKLRVVETEHSRLSTLDGNLEDVRVQVLQTIRERTQEYFKSLQLIDVCADGKCLFMTISQAVAGAQGRHQWYRKQAADYIEKNN